MLALGGTARHLATQSSASDVATTGGTATPTGGQEAPSLASQLVPALAALHSTPDGASHVTVRLDPAELGQVHVQITRAQDGAASVSVSVERPETLRSLQGDLSHLHQALDRAGVSEQRSVSLHLAPPELGLAANGGGGQSGSQAGPQHQEGRSRTPESGGSDAPSKATTVPDPPAPTRWLRAGVNITA